MTDAAASGRASGPSRSLGTASYNPSVLFDIWLTVLYRRFDILCEDKRMDVYLSLLDNSTASGNVFHASTTRTKV